MNVYELPEPLMSIERLQNQHTQLQASFEQVLTSSSELLALHVTLLEQHLHLQARIKVSASAVTHYRNQFLEYRTKLDAQLTSSQQTSSQLQETRLTSAKYDKLAAQIPQEDPILRSIEAHNLIEMEIAILTDWCKNASLTRDSTDENLIEGSFNDSSCLF